MEKQEEEIKESKCFNVGCSFHNEWSTVSYGFLPAEFVRGFIKKHTKPKCKIEKSSQKGVI